MPARIPVIRLWPALVVGASLLTACGGEDPAALVADARAKMTAGDYKAAMIQLKNAVAADEKNAEARFELGRLYYDQHDFASAEKEFRRARNAGYDRNAVDPMIAQALLGQREYQRLLDELPAQAGNTPETSTLQALRATAELGLGRREEARKMLQSSAQSAPDNPEVQLALARLALADRDADRALQALDQALQITPGHIESLLLKGDLLRALGKSDEAATMYGEALKLAPRRVNTRLALASIALSENQPGEARKHVEATLKAMPNNLQARYTLALIDFNEKKTEQARDTLASVLKAAPDYGPALLLGGAIEYALGNLQMAETHLNKAIKASPNNLYALRLLAATQLRQGRPDDAARTLAPALKSSSQNAGVLTIAGEIALARKDFAQASLHFEQAAKLSPDSAAIRTELGIARLAGGDDRAMADLQAAAGMQGSGGRADTVIILSQLRQKQYDAALASIAALERKQAANPLTWNYRGAAFLGKQDSVRARDSFSQALKLDPEFFPAAVNLAQLDLQANQPAAARQRFEGILKANPSHLSAMLALADLSLRSKDAKAYVGWLEKAAAAHPQALQPRVALARHLLVSNEKNKALAVARDAANAQPDSPVALDLLGTTQLALGDTPNALVSYRKLVERLPGEAAPLIKLAAAQGVAKDRGGARKSLQDALRVEPDLLEAQLMLGRFEIEDARYDDALRIARQIQQQKPKSAAGPMLEGDIAQARKQFNAALAAYERAHGLEPSGALLIRQHQALEGLGRPEEGEKRLAAWLGKRPQDAGTRMALAERLVKRNQHKAAAEHYLLLNQSYPGNLVVLNNLAWAYSELGDPRARAFADQALKLQPDNPAVLDTHGWVLTRLGDPAKGLVSLKKSLSRSPDDAEVNWHLAYALNASGDKARARQELKTLLDRGISFPSEADARILYKQLSIVP